MEISDVQIKALKYLIFKSKDAGPETKKICLALIEASEKLTKPVYFTSNSKDTKYGIHDLVSCNGSTHLQEILRATGSNMLFSFNSGYFASSGIFKEDLKEEEKYTHTIWLSVPRHCMQAIEIIKSDVEKVELRDPLYNF